MKQLDRVVLSASTPTITFSNISQDYDELYVQLSVRSTHTGLAYDPLLYRFNASDTGYSSRQFGGDSNSYSGGESTRASTVAGGTWGRITYNGINTADTSANTFSSVVIRVNRYRDAAYKSLSYELAHPPTYSETGGSLWQNNGAVTSLSFALGLAQFAQHSTATLYGVRRVSSPLATGGYVSFLNGYWYHTFTNSGTFATNSSVNAEILAVAGGGAGGATQTSSQRGGGGGGAGGYLAQSIALPVGSYPIAIGAGGSGVNTLRGLNGNNTTAFGLTAVGGGGGGGGPDSSTISGAAGGSGGGGYSENGGIAVGGARTVGQGNVGENGNYATSSDFFGGGGGGAGEAGGTDQGGSGGDGLQWLNGSYYAGGGAGATSTNYSASGGLGGGANGPRGGGAVSGYPGTFATGGGGSGALSISEATGQTGGNGGSGVVIVRYLG